MKVCIVGATGLVGTALIKVLSERKFPVTQLIPVASSTSHGRSIEYAGANFDVIDVKHALLLKPQIALFSAGSGVSKQFAPLFAEGGCKVIDNSSAWRMDPSIKLVVPEVNGDVLDMNDYIIANPNCSTIQMVMVAKPLHDRYKIMRIVVSTYQSVTGTGQKAVDEMFAQRNGATRHTIYPHAIDLNLIPHIDVFQDNAYTKEEMKMVQETCKIMGDDTIRVSATCVRVPVIGGHSESVNIQFQKDFDINDVMGILGNSPGIKLTDDIAHNKYPMPLDAMGSDDVFVGRIRRDFSMPNTLNCWVVSDNLRKGAATNAVQIAEWLLHKRYI